MSTESIPKKLTPEELARQEGRLVHPNKILSIMVGNKTTSSTNTESTSKEPPAKKDCSKKSTLVHTDHNQDALNGC